MDTAAYDIVFSGSLLAGRDPAQVRAELARLFKTDVAGIERLFCGQTVIIKKGIDRQTADKYRAVLEKAGALCEVRTHASTDEAAGTASRMTIAPAGELLAAADSVVPPVFNLGHMSLAEVGVDILGAAASMVAPPMYDLTAFSVAPPGTELVTAVRPESMPLPDISALTMAEPGSDLDTGSTAATITLPDISSMSLAPAGTAVIRPEEVKPRPAASDSAGNRLTLETTRAAR